MANVDTIRAAVAPESDRGNAVAAGTVLLTALVYLLNDRFDGTWGAGIHLLYSAVAAALVLGMAWMSVPTNPPRPYQSVLYVAGFALALAVLANLADILGANDPLGASGTIVWVGTLLTLLAASFSVGRDSAASTLLAALTAGIVVLAFVDWVFSPESFSTFRYLLAVIAIGYALLALQRREPQRHAVQFMNAAGFAALTIALSFAFLAVISSFVADEGDIAGVAWGWELFLLLAACGLIAYAYATREPAPGYLGAVNLLAYVLLAGDAEATLLGWPLVLAVLSGAALFAALRPGPAAPRVTSAPPAEPPATAVPPTAPTAPVDWDEPRGPGSP